jgi:hypothetical protein
MNITVSHMKAYIILFAGIPIRHLELQRAYKLPGK